MSILEWFLQSDYNGQMKSVGIAELKARLTQYLRRVKAGQELVVSDRGEPIAKIVPLGREQKRGARRRRLVRAGLLHPGRGRAARALAAPAGPESLGESVLAALLAERAEQR